MRFDIQIFQFKIKKKFFYRLFRSHAKNTQQKNVYKTQIDALKASE